MGGQLSQWATAISDLLLVVEGYIEIGADKHAFASHVDLFDIFV